MCGSGLRIRLHSGETVELSDSEVSLRLRSLVRGKLTNPSQPVLIPLSEDIEQFDVDEGLAWVLVVEKEVRVDTCSLISAAADRRISGGVSDSVPAQTRNPSPLARQGACAHRTAFVRQFYRCVPDAL